MTEVVSRLGYPKKMLFLNFETRETERSSVGSYNLIAKKMVNFLKIFLLKQPTEILEKFLTRFRDFPIK